MSDNGFEVPDYESLTDIADIDAEIAKHKANLVGKDILESKLKNDKKEYVSALNTQIKELTEEREHEIDVISALEQRKQVVAAGNTGKAPKIPGPTKVSAN